MAVLASIRTGAWAACLGVLFAAACTRPVRDQCAVNAAHCPTGERPSGDSGAAAPATATDGGAPDLPATAAIDSGAETSAASPDVAAEDPGPAAPRDGTRLKFIWIGPPGGPRAPLGYYDSQLGTRCFSGRAADGEQRCLPEDNWSFGYSFADAACTVPVAIVHSTSCPTSELAVVFKAQAPIPCGGYTTSIHRRGQQITTGDVFFANTTTGVCGAGVPLPAAAKVYAAGAEVPATMFVKMTIGAGASATGATGPLAPSFIESEDGLREPIAFHDPATKERCSIYAAADGTTRCVTGGISSFSPGGFADASCNNEPLLYHGGCAPTARFASLPQPGTCPRRNSLAAIGAPPPQSYSLVSATGACTANPPQITARYSALGPAGAEAMFPELKTVIEPTGGRLRRRLVGAPGGRMVFTREWFDIPLNEVCSPRLLASGTYRCIPASTEFLSVNHYADAGCTQPLWRGVAGQCLPKYVTTYDDKVCPARYTQRVLGPEHRGAVYTRSGSGPCNFFNPPPGAIFHPVPAASEEQFAEMVLDPPPG